MLWMMFWLLHFLRFGVLNQLCFGLLRLNLRFRMLYQFRFGLLCLFRFGMLCLLFWFLLVFFRTPDGLLLGCFRWFGVRQPIPKGTRWFGVHQSMPKGTGGRCLGGEGRWRQMFAILGAAIVGDEAAGKHFMVSS